MRTIAHQGIVSLHPRIAAHGGQHSRRIIEVIIYQTRHHRHSIGEVQLEKCIDFLGRP